MGLVRFFVVFFKPLKRFGLYSYVSKLMTEVMGCYWKNNIEY